MVQEVGVILELSGSKVGGVTFLFVSQQLQQLTTTQTKLTFGWYLGVDHIAAKTLPKLLVLDLSLGGLHVFWLQSSPLVFENERSMRVHVDEHHRNRPFSFTRFLALAVLCSRIRRLFTLVLLVPVRGVQVLEVLSILAGPEVLSILVPPAPVKYASAPD